MSPPTQGTHKNILLPFNVMNIKVILIQELHPTTLSCIQVWLSKDILQAPMITMQLKPVPQEEMSLLKKIMYYGHKFQIMSGAVKFMVLEFPRLICNHSTILHQHHTYAF